MRTLDRDLFRLSGGLRSLRTLVLYVVVSEPSCSVNISLPGHAVHESDLVQVKCIIDYKGGNWTPVVNCTPEVQLVRDRSTSYIGVIAASDIGDMTVISCEIRFVQTERILSQQVEIVPDPPRYIYSLSLIHI